MLVSGALSEARILVGADLPPLLFGNLNHLLIVADHLALVSQTMQVPGSIIPKGLMRSVFVVEFDVASQRRTGNL